MDRSATPGYAPEGADEEPAAVDVIRAWGAGYARRHPVAAIETVGRQFLLGVETLRHLVRDVLRGSFPFEEFVRQGAFMAATSVVPTLLVALPVGVTLSIQFTNVAGQIGATSLAGAASGLAIVRQGASLAAAMLLATAVGSAICADLGSRTMREEIDALEVLGVSVIRRLVVPRFVAAVMVAVLLTGITCVVGFVATYTFNVYFQNGVPGSFLSSFSSFATVGDMWLALGKAVLFGAIVAIVACQKGLNTRGGPADVANSVNAAIVESILVLLLVNVIVSQLYIVLFPRTGL